MKFEKNIVAQKDSPAEDYLDSPELYNLLKRMPDALAELHIAKIEKDDLSDEDAAVYLKDILQRREGVVRITEISDSNIQAEFQGREEEVFSYIENELAIGDRNLRGEGATAKVKSFYFKGTEREIPIAVKYLLTPLSTTLSASGEHDMLKEVERIQRVEDLEKKDKDKLKHLRVPHPYFHHKNKDIQCYGMELIEGVDLHQGIQNDWESEEQRESVRRALEGVSLETLLEEVEIFFANMHDFCLHGDVKPANIMVGNDGTFYIIDFGQSQLITSITQTSEDYIFTKKEDEKQQAREAIRRFYHTLF